MSAESNKTNVIAAVIKLELAIDMIGDALALVSKAAPAGHDATLAIYDAKRVAEVAKAKLELLRKRLP